MHTQFFFLAVLALAVDASHARRSFVFKHRSPLNDLGLSGALKGLNGGLNGVLAPSSPSTYSDDFPSATDDSPSATNDAPSHTDSASSNAPSASCNGLLGIGCSPAQTTQPAASPSPCNDLLGLGCSPSSSNNNPPQTTQQNSPPPSSPSPSPPSSPSPSPPSSPSSPPPSSPSPSCDGLLGLGLGCPASSSQAPSPPAQTSPAATSPPPPPSPAPTSSCDGLLGLGLGCPAPSSQAPSPPAQTSPAATSPPPPPSPASTSSCDGLLGLGLGCPAPSSQAPSPPAQTSPAATSPPPPPSPASTSSCDGLLGLGLGCPPPSTNSPTSPPAPPASPTQPPSASTSPTPACNGVLDLVLGCIPSSSSNPTAPAASSSTPYEAPSTHPAPSPTCGGLLGLDCPPSTSLVGTQSQHPSPTATCNDLLGIPCASATTPIWSTASLSNSAVISFPHSITHTVSAEPTSLITAATSTSNSNYDYLSSVSSLLLNTASPTMTTQTVSDPDQAATTFSLLQVAPTSSPTAAPLPSGLPRVILPQPPLDLNTLPSDDVMVNILFNGSLNWEFVATHADSAGQIFANMPTILATALNMSVADVHNYDLIVYEPSSYTGPQDVAKLGTIWQGFIPKDKVQTLASLIMDVRSSFYTDQANSITTALAACVDPTFELDAIVGPAPGGSATSSASSGSGVRQDAIIGVVSSLGAIAIMIVAYVGYKAYRRRRALAHRRLSDGTGHVGVRPDGQEFDRDSVGGQRRRSFYYAEDSLRGFQSSRGDEDGYDHHASNMRERRAVQPGAISTPILRESTMNW